MGLIILLPALACWIVMARGGLRQALLAVYLPCLLLLPQYYIYRLPHLPPLSFADAAIIPLGAGMLITEMRRWRFTWMDLWVFLSAASVGLSEALSTELANGQWIHLFSGGAITSETRTTNIANGELFFIDGLLTMVLPYMAGKLLIEHQQQVGLPMRRKFVARIVGLLAIVAFISVHDFVARVSTWQQVGVHFFPDQFVHWIPQVRWGFGRIAGPYGHAILAGMVFLMGLVYVVWLRSVDPAWGSRRLIAGLPINLRGLILAAIVGGLLMTQSRGPWIGVGLALVFALLTRYLSVGKAAVAFLILAGVFSIAAYYIGNAYTQKQSSQVSNEEQRNAIYRRELIGNYMPIVMQRKAFGWGVLTYPKIDGQDSIDNQYLLLAVTQGFFGLSLFLAVAAGTAARLLRLLAVPRLAEDRLLLFSHLALLIGLLTTLATVYMGEQVVMLFYLYAGWVQGMSPAPVDAPATNFPARPLRFRKVLV